MGEPTHYDWPDVHNVEGSECTCDEHRADPHLVANAVLEADYVTSTVARRRGA